MTKASMTAAIAAGILAVAPLAFAQGTTTPTTGGTSVAAKITCVGTAVAARESAIGAAVSAHASAVTAAYTARASALAAAYQKTTAKDVRMAVRAAWSAFTKATKQAQKDWMTARNAAWKTYRAAAVACAAPEGVGDGGNSGSEVSGS